MITIRSLNIKDNSIVETKFWQSWLNTFEGEKLKVDGDYGELTKKATERYQIKYGLEPDGMAGQITLNYAGFLSTKNSKIVVLKIPFSRIEKANVLLKDGEHYTCEKFAKEGNYDIAINGAFFELATRKIVQFVTIAGKVKQWGMANSGVAFPNNWSKAVPKTRNEVIGQPYDMIVGAPVLIQNSKKDLDRTGISNAIMNEITKRNCIGVTSDALYLFFTVGGCTLYEMQDEGIYQKVVYMAGLDGGASQAIYMGGNYVLSGRTLPCVIGLKIKKLLPSSTTPTTKEHLLNHELVKVQLIPKTAKGRRPQLEMKPEYITIHSTGVPTATAKNNADNVHNNKPDTQVSWHFAIDDKEAWQVLPLNEVGWHAGDGYNGTGNRKSVGVEICENGDRKKALENAIELTYALMKELNIDIDHIKQHNNWSGKDCPRILRNKTYIKEGLDWNWFMKQLKAKFDNKPVTPDNKLYRVQVGAFSNKENAEKYQEELKSKGYSTIIKQDEK